jgi:hypothetical protein
VAGRAPGPVLDRGPAITTRPPARRPCPASRSPRR